jgi:hypothetical protein
MAVTIFSGLEGSFVHGGASAALFCHSQRRRKAKPRMRKSGSPRPPWSRGELTTGQATLHLPPDTTSVPHHRKARRRLPICLMAHADKEQVMETCTGMALRG